MGSWAAGAVNETIGAGQDYTTIAAFESAHDGEIPTDGTLCTGTVVGTPADGSNIYWSGWQSGQNATTRVVLKANIYTDGDDGSGDGIIEDRLYIYGAGIVYLDLLGIEFHNTSVSSIYWSPDSVSQLQVALCAFRDSGYVPIVTASVGAVITRIAACLFKDTASGGGECGFSIVDDDAVDFEAWNCTAIGATGADACYDEQLSVVGPKIFNCAGANTGTADFEWRSNDIYEDYNASEDTSVNGTHSVTGLAMNDSDDFTAPSTDDYTVYDASSILYQAGTNQPSWFDTITGGVDMKGVSWHATTPSIGCFEYEVSGGSTIQGACTDGFSLSESIGKAAIFSALAQESINLADSDLNIASFLSAIADSLVMSDQVIRAVNFPVVVSDNFTLTDSVIAEDLLAISALVNETLNFSDTAVSRADFIVAIQENVTLSDASVNLLSAIAQVTEALNISDAVFWAGIQSAFATDSLTISDQVTRIFQTFASVAENFNVSDAPGVTATFDVTVTDIVQFAEAISNIAAFRASVVDGFNIQATPMEVSTLPNGKVSVSFSIKVPGVGMEMKTATIVFNIT